MDAEPIYLDHNATTPLHGDVLDAMLPYLRTHFGNPSSAHAYGRRAAEAIAEARSRVARLIGAAPTEVVFTSGGTEANNLALLGAAAARPERTHWVQSAIEHPAVSEPLAALEARGHRVTTVEVQPNGQVLARSVAAAATSDTNAVSIMLANNETGALQPVADIDLGSSGAWLHTDASQAVGKIPVCVRRLGVDLLTIAGHKLYAPKGVGALFVRSGVELGRVSFGASHERGLSPGTENVASIVGLGAACDLARSDLEHEMRRQAHLREVLWERLREDVPGIRRNVDGAASLPNTLSVCFPDVAGPSLLAHCPEVAASTSSACHSDRTQTSAVLRAMGIPVRVAMGAVRLTLGRETQDVGVQRAAQHLIRAWTALQDTSS